MWREDEDEGVRSLLMGFLAGSKEEEKRRKRVRKGYSSFFYFRGIFVVNFWVDIFCVFFLYFLKKKNGWDNLGFLGTRLRRE